MNITELARRLKVSPYELRLILRSAGIDIGDKAIKIDKKLAKRVLEEWNSIYARYQKMKKEEEEKAKEEKERASLRGKIIKLPPLITVKELALLLNFPINKLMEVLMKNGIFVSLNEKIDYETAAIVALDLGVKVKKMEEEKEEEKEDYLEELLKSSDGQDIRERPPVVVVMGHVDHGKTKLLDYIRKTNVVDKEAGGITQHIGAYQVKRKDSLLTFIDTPGHEAFTAMRSRGAKVADVAILVVAADDGVKPQTIEAIKIAEKFQLPFVVAINKIDKPEANIEKVKQELSRHGVVPEDWGGKAVCVPISAKEGTGVQDLLDMVLLTTEMDKEKRMVDWSGKAVGTIIEAHLDKAEGPVATVLIQKGTLKKGDFINANKNFAGKIRSMKDHQGRLVEEATPSMPVRILGLKYLVEVGDVIEATQEKGKTKKIYKTESKIEKVIRSQQEEEEEDKGGNLVVLLKTDVLGSAEVIMESLEKIEVEGIKIKVINRGLGNITESDILQAETVLNAQHPDSRALLIGFNVKVPPTTANFAKEKNIPIYTYQVIYELLDKVKETIREMIKPEFIKKETGEIEILAIFKKEKKSMIVGGKVKKGHVENGEKLLILRNNEEIGQGVIQNLQSGKQPVSSVEEGQECGLLYEGEVVLREGDILVAYQEEEVKKKI